MTSAFGPVAAFALLILIAVAYGCQKSSPPTDLAKAPWRLDPQSQIKGLKDGDHRIRGLSALNLGNLAAKASEAVRELERIAREDPDPKVRENAQEAVGKIRAAAK